MRATVEQDELPAETKEKLADLIRKVIQPAGIEDLLRPKVIAIRRSWRDYLNNRGAILEELVKRGLVVRPDLKLTPEYLNYRNAQGGLLPTGEYAHLEQVHRDGWNRFIEARVNAGPDRVVLLTPENNILPNYDGMELSKHKPALKTPRVESLDDATKALIAAHAAAKQLKDMRVGDIAVGVDYQGIKYTGRMFKIYHLGAIFRAQLLDQLPPNIDNMVIGDVTLYPPKPRFWEEGGEAIVRNLPSIGRPGRVHYVNLIHIPGVDRNHGDNKLVTVTADAVVMSYNFQSRTSSSEDETLWPIKYERDGRTGDEVWLSYSTILAAIKTMRKAHRQLEGGEAPGREFVVLPMFPQIPFEAMREFRKFYGAKTSTGATGGVILEAATRSVKGGFDREVVERRTLSGRLVDLEIALHNLVAFAQYDLTPQRPKLAYAAAVA